MREPRAADRPTFVELRSSPDVHTYLGGARSRAEVEGELAAVPDVWPGGTLVVEHEGRMVGVVLLRQAHEHHRAALVGRVELGYLFLPTAWGKGFAGESCGVVLEWLARALPDAELVLVTQSANIPSMRLAKALGFVEAEQFEAFGAQQWLGTRPARPGP